MRAMMNKSLFRLVMSSLLLGVLAWADTPPGGKTEGIVVETPGLAPARTFSKLRQGKPVKVVFLGGSITFGTGATNPNATSYRALVTQWLQSTYPQAKVTGINAGVGGTGSDWGTFRCAPDVLLHKPDLVFVEFGVNDEYRSQDSIQESMEGIVRQILKADPATEIVFIYTTTQFFSSPYKKGELPKTIQYQQAVAVHYGIPGINVGYPLWKQVMTDGKWEVYLPDRTHPSDAGYRLYADQIIAYLKRHVDDKEGMPTGLPPSLTSRPLESPKRVNPGLIKAEGWTKDDAALKKVTALGLACAEPGRELTFPFNGTFIGLSWIMAPDSGDIEWSVDGGAVTRRSSWDKYSEKSTRRNIAVLNDRLAPGDHVLTLRVAKDKAPKSTGTAIRIISFLVD